MAPFNPNNPFPLGHPNHFRWEVLNRQYGPLAAIAVQRRHKTTTTASESRVPVESFVGNYYGWRFFAVRKGQLGAVSQGTIYKPGQAAVCQNGGNHTSPSYDCSCGYYAHNTLETLLTDGYRGTGRVLGLVQASGRIIEHESGFRAEYLTPVNLFFQPFTLPGLVKRLRKVWGCKTTRWSWPQDVVKKGDKYPNLRTRLDGLTFVPFTELNMKTVGPSDAVYKPIIKGWHTP